MRIISDLPFSPPHGGKIQIHARFQKFRFYKFYVVFAWSEGKAISKLSLYCLFPLIITYCLKINELTHTTDMHALPHSAWKLSFRIELAANQRHTNLFSHATSLLTDTHRHSLTIRDVKWSSPSICLLFFFLPICYCFSYVLFSFFFFISDGRKQSK